MSLLGCAEEILISLAKEPVYGHPSNALEQGKYEYQVIEQAKSLLEQYNLIHYNGPPPTPAILTFEELYRKNQLASFVNWSLSGKGSLVIEQYGMKSGFLKKYLDHTNNPNPKPHWIKRFIKCFIFGFLGCIILGGIFYTWIANYTQTDFNNFLNSQLK
jgi:hypothetical protein